MVLLLNNFRKGERYDPLKFLKENITFLLRSIRLFFLNGFKNRTVLFYPEYPCKKAIVYKILKQMRYNVSNNPRHKHALAFSWEDATYKDKPGRVDSEHWVNANCLDISKTYVDEVFYKVFGYRTVVDPLTYAGKCVQKSDINAQHDGKVIQCPIDKKEEGYIYQILINNEVKEGFVEDIRLPVFKDEFPHVYIRRHRLQDRFGETVRSWLKDVNERISPDELSKIKIFCKKMSLDFGDLDLLRDRDTGLLYVVDVNPTAWAPGKDLTAEDHQKAMSSLLKLFRKVFLNQH